MVCVDRRSCYHSCVDMSDHLSECGRWLVVGVFMEPGFDILDLLRSIVIPPGLWLFLLYCVVALQHVRPLLLVLGLVYDVISYVHSCLDVPVILYTPECLLLLAPEGFYCESSRAHWSLYSISEPIWSVNSVHLIITALQTPLALEQTLSPLHKPSHIQAHIVFTDTVSTYEHKLMSDPVSVLPTNHFHVAIIA